MRDEPDQVLDEEQWKQEAEAVINDVKRHVGELKLSEVLRSTNQHIFMNLTTLEGLKYCIELSGTGFAIVGNKHDDATIMGNELFETPYSLLDSVSPLYRNSFGILLVDKLNELSKQE